MRRLARISAVLASLLLAVTGAFAQTPVRIAPDGTTMSSIVPTTTTAMVTSTVVKSSAGNLYSLFATNMTGSAGMLVVLNQTSTPTSTASNLKPAFCVPVPANGQASLDLNPGPASWFSVGIVAVVTNLQNANSCYNLSTNTGTAFISGNVQ